MNIDAVALIDVLKSEKESYQDLLNLARKEQELLLNGDAEGLTDVVKAMESRMIVARDLEEERLTLLKEAYGRDFQSPPELSAIVKHLDETVADKASILREEMLAIIKDLDETNRTNVELLKRNVKHVDFILGLVAGDENPLYTKEPNPRSSDPKLFDGRA